MPTALRASLRTIADEIERHAKPDIVVTALDNLLAATEAAP